MLLGQKGRYDPSLERKGHGRSCKATADTADLLRVAAVDMVLQERRRRAVVATARLPVAERLLRAAVTARLPVAERLLRGVATARLPVAERLLRGVATARLPVVERLLRGVATARRKGALGLLRAATGRLRGLPRAGTGRLRGLPRAGTERLQERWLRVHLARQWPARQGR